MIIYSIKHPNAKSPKRSTTGSAGLDLTCVSVTQYRNNMLEYDTGVAFQIPYNMVGVLVPRSSVSNVDLLLANSIGVIDSDYRGTVKFRYRVLGDKTYAIGERVGQILFLPVECVDLIDADSLEPTERGEDGFGSTD